MSLRTPLATPLLRRRAAAPRRSGRRGTAFLAFPLLLLAAPATEELAAQISVQPVIVEMRVAGAAAATSFLVRNEATEPLALQVYASDFDQPLEGGHTFLASGQHPRSCADRVQYFPESFTLPAGGAQEVRLSMAPGAATCWSLVFVQTVPDASAAIAVAQRIGVKVYGVDPAAAPAGEIRAVALDPDPETRGMLLRLDFENQGEDPLRPEGELEIRGMDGNVLGVAPIPAFSVLPGHVRRTVVALELDLPPGEYLAIPILDFGAEYLAGGQAVFRVPGG